MGAVQWLLGRGGVEQGQPPKRSTRTLPWANWVSPPGQRGGGGANDPGNNQHNPQYANYWAPLTRTRHIPPHSAQPRHTNDGAPRTRKRHQREHRPQRPTERSDPTQHAKGRAGDCPGPRNETTTRRNVTRGVHKMTLLRPSLVSAKHTHHNATSLKRWLLSLCCPVALCLVVGGHGELSSSQSHRGPGGGGQTLKQSLHGPSVVASKRGCWIKRRSGRWMPPTLGGSCAQHPPMYCIRCPTPCKIAFWETKVSPNAILLF